MMMGGVKMDRRSIDGHIIQHEPTHPSNKKNTVLDLSGGKKRTSIVDDHPSSAEQDSNQGHQLKSALKKMPQPMLANSNAHAHHEQQPQQMRPPPPTAAVVTNGTGSAQSYENVSRPPSTVSTAVCDNVALA